MIYRLRYLSVPETVNVAGHFGGSDFAPKGTAALKPTANKQQQRVVETAIVRVQLTTL